MGPAFVGFPRCGETARSPLSKYFFDNRAPLSPSMKPVHILAVLAAAAAASPLVANKSRTLGSSSARGSIAALSPNVEIVVGIAPNVDPSALAASVGAQLEPLTGRAPMVRLSVAPNAVERTTARLARTAGVKFVEKKHSVRTPETTVCAPTQGAGTQQCTAAFYDATPLLAKYWSQPALPAIKLEAVPLPPSGSYTVVAVIDSGIDATHPVLAGRVIGGYDFVAGDTDGSDVADGLDNDLDGYVDEAFGHGTHVAGTIALIDPAALFLSYRVLDADGNGYAHSVADAVYAAVEAGAEIINLSLGLAEHSHAVEVALEFADANNVQIYASAGNTGNEQVLYPAAYPWSVAVAAIDSNDAKAGFSAYGLRVDVSAPGVDVYGPMPGGKYAWWSGTSMATAIASGAASRLMSATAETLIEFESESIAESLVDASTPIESANPLELVGKLGAGKVDLAQAVVDLVLDADPGDGDTGTGGGTPPPPPPPPPGDDDDDDDDGVVGDDD